MPEQVKPRPYNSPVRAARAAATRAAVLAAARRLFLANGYPGTTARDIAAQAGVSVDTVYATVGRKPELMLALVEQAISGADRAVPAEQRDYVLEIRAATTAAAKIERYAAALSRLQPRLAPLVRVLGQAAATDPACGRLWQDIASRRAANMRLYAEDLRATGELRTDLSVQEVADIVWSTNAPEYYLLLVERGWTPQQYERWLVDLWTRTLLSAS